MASLQVAANDFKWRVTAYDALLYRIRFNMCPGTYALEFLPISKQPQTGSVLYLFEGTALDQQLRPFQSDGRIVAYDPILIDNYYFLCMLLLR